jgi:hypothetical protein
LRGDAVPLSATERQELVELRRRLKQVQMERDILAKATAWLLSGLVTLREELRRVATMPGDCTVYPSDCLLGGLMPGQAVDAPRRTRPFGMDKGLATRIANPLTFLAPRPGLEPGTYGLTVPGDGISWDLLIQVAFQILYTDQ